MLKVNTFVFTPLARLPLHHNLVFAKYTTTVYHVLLVFQCFAVFLYFKSRTISPHFERNTGNDIFK